MFDLTKRFSIGINVDDPWTYAGLKPPKSITMPHYVSARLPFTILERMKERREPPADDRVVSKADAQSASLSLVERLVAAKLRFVRCWFPWRYFEWTPRPESELEGLVDQSYEDSPMDTFVDIMTDHGIGVLPVIACGYQRFLPYGMKVDSSPEVYLKRASLHARLLVRKHREKIRFWQIENEPNWWHMHSVGGWREGSTWIHPKGFRVRLVKELNDAVHSEDPSAQTIINLEADTKLAGAAPVAEHCDIIGLDFYPNYKKASPIDVSILSKSKAVADRTGKPVMVVETGYPSGPGFRGYSPARQAEYVRKVCSKASALEVLTAIGLWRYSDSPWRSFPLMENHFGLVDRQDRPKPAWTALSEMAENLAT